MYKVLYNSCYGGYGYSNEFKEAWFAHKGIEYIKKQEGTFHTGYKTKDSDHYLYVPGSRHDPELVAFIEDYISKGLNPSSSHADIHIAEIQSNKYIIDEYDGAESVIEPDDIDWIPIEE